MHKRQYSWQCGPTWAPSIAVNHTMGSRLPPSDEDRNRNLKRMGGAERQCSSLSCCQSDSHPPGLQNLRIPLLLLRSKSRNHHGLRRFAGLGTVLAPGYSANRSPAKFGEECLEPYSCKSLLSRSARAWRPRNPSEQTRDSNIAAVVVKNWPKFRLRFELESIPEGPDIAGQSDRRENV